MRQKDIWITVGLILLLAIPIVVAQIWASARNAAYVERVVEQMQAQDATLLKDEKIRHEIVSLRIKNEIQGFFWHSLWTSLGPILTALVALSGGLFGLQKYLDARNAERLERAAGELETDLEHLISDQPWKKAVGIVGLQQFFSEDKQAYHARALSALVTAARLETTADLYQVYRVAVEQAVRQLPVETLRRVSWRGIGLEGADFSNANLSGTDFRDANLENANLAGCDLSESDLTAARFLGANLQGASLVGAELAYTDFAGASLRGADLTRARLVHPGVWRMDIGDADLRGCEFEPEEIRWDLIQSWRQCRMDPAILAELVERYGPEVGDYRVLLLSWEVPPMVAGGTWTATYHLVRNLRRLGVDVTVAVPWEARSVLPDPFGCEVELVPLGVSPPAPGAGSPYGVSAWSPYGRAVWPRAGAVWSPYGGAQDVYGGLYSPYSFGGIYAGHSAYGGAELRQGSSVLRLADDFRRRLQRYCRQERFNLIHAQDWVTFHAAEEAARRMAIPWVAHFHSLEVDRRRDRPDSVIQGIEARGVAQADALVVPSKATARRLIDAYRPHSKQPVVVPNALSREEVSASESGRFESKTIVYLGRLTHQKGADRLRELAARVSHHHACMFHVYGAGELVGSLAHASHIWYRGNLPWDQRELAFREATAVVVPSRSEPFGMVVLEAMQHGVPVVYPADAGVAEVVQAGVPVDTSDLEAMAAALGRLLSDWEYWDDVVSSQLEAVSRYPDSGFEQPLRDLWKGLCRPGESQS